MDKSVYEYKKRRQARLNDKKPVRMDAVEEYRYRREKRIAARFDGRYMGWVFSALKKEGVDVSGMDLGEAIEKWNEVNQGKKGKEKSEVGGTPKSRNNKDWKSEAKKVKGVTIKKGESGFEVPVFDEATFEDNIEEKKMIAREAAKALVPDVKKALSTKVSDITRPKVDEETRKYLKDNVNGVKDEQIDRALKEADKIYKYWEEHEPEITETVVDAVKKVGGSMYGLNNRRKFDKSLAKKALADALDPRGGFEGNIEEAAQNIKDGARYTAVFGSDDYVEGYNKVKEALAKMGIKEYRCKNFFTQYRGQDGKDGKIGEQKSIQCVFETPDGQKFELQFHTPESMAAKEVNHPTYKQKKEPPSENREYNEPRSLFMRDTSSVVPDPDAVFDIEEHKRGETGYN